jgi:hypothetical protein
MIQQLYNDSPYNKIMHEIDGQIIPFDKSWKKVSIALSGGADSAMLAFLICQIITEFDLSVEVHFINSIREWKTKPWQQHIAAEVVTYFNDRFTNIKFFLHKNFIPPEFEWGDTGPTMLDEYGKLVSGDNIELRAFTEYVCTTNDIPAYFNAVTKNPPVVSGGMPTRDAEPCKENFHLTIMNHLGIIACHPFRFTTKDWIIKQYSRLGITDLLSITRSCEGIIEGLDYTNYLHHQLVPVCGKCFWCKEREWAIEQTK